MLYVFAVRFESGRSSCSRRQTKANILTRTAQQDVAGCGWMWPDCGWMCAYPGYVPGPKNFSPTCKMLIHFQVDFCSPFGRVAWTGFLSLTCRAEATLAFTVRKPESSKEGWKQEQQTHKCQLNKMFRFKAGKKGAGVGTFPFPLTLSLSLCLSLSLLLPLGSSAICHLICGLSAD